MNGPTGTSSEDEAVRLELFRRVRAEGETYLRMVPSLWLQKLALVGVVIAFVLARSSEFESADAGLSPDALIDLSIVTVAALAVLIDIRILEVSLHGRVVSDFIAAEFGATRGVANWEALLWGESGDQRSVMLSRTRSVLTVIATAVPTVFLIALCGTAVAIRRDSLLLVWCTVAVATLYVAAAVGFSVLVFVKPARASGTTTPARSG